VAQDKARRILDAERESTVSAAALQARDGASFVQKQSTRGTNACG